VTRTGRSAWAGSGRSLAWHIARRPNGLVALAIQYGHMRTALAYDWTTEGYGSRSRAGIHDLIDLETARATADTVMDLHESIESGGGISGPAARRAAALACSTADLPQPNTAGAASSDVISRRQTRPPSGSGALSENAPTTAVIRAWA
jgi:hypothetical protein